MNEEVRRHSLGSSDIAAVVGRDPWRTPADLYLEKTGRLGPLLRPSPAMEAGTFLEHGLLDWAGHRFGTPLARRQVPLVHPRYPTLTATLDGVTADGELVEAKTAGLVGGGLHLDDWGDAETDQVPTHVFLQAQYQLGLATAQETWPMAPPTRCHVPALLMRRGLVMFVVERHDALVEVLVDRALRFWRDYVVTDQCPPDTLPSLDVLVRIGREPASTVPIPEATVLRWQDAKAQVKEAEERERAAYRALLASLGTAEAGTCALGTALYLERTRRAYQVQAAKYRQLVWKPAAQREKEAS